MPENVLPSIRYAFYLFVFAIPFETASTETVSTIGSHSHDTWNGTDRSCAVTTAGLFQYSSWRILVLCRLLRDLSRSRY